MASNTDIAACAKAIEQLALIDGELDKSRQRIQVLQGKRDQVQAEVDGRKHAMLNGTTYVPPTPQEPAVKRGIFGGIIKPTESKDPS